MTKFPDYCPISEGVEILGDRWTPLVIRELMVGSTGFNEIHRGLPRMSRSLLSSRLRNLERRGLVVRGADADGGSRGYRLTPAGAALSQVVLSMGNWAAEWAFDDPADEECDGLSLLWRMHQVAIPAKLPPTKTFVHLRLTGPGAAEGWLNVDGGEVTVCRDNPGFDVDLAVEAETRDMHRWLVGQAPFRQLARDGRVRLMGPSKLSRTFPSWFNTDMFAVGFARAKQHVS